jgi:hypothetical protein
MSEDLEKYLGDVNVPRMSHAERKEKRLDVATYAREHGVDAACQHYGERRNYVRRTMSECGMAVKSHARSRAARMEAAEYAKAHGVAAAVKKYEMSAATIYRGLMDIGGGPVHKKPRTEHRTYIVLARLQAGEMQSDIARDLEVTRQYVSLIKIQAEKAGMKFPGGKNEQE